MRGPVRETERVKQVRQEKVQWCRGVGVLEPVFRKDIAAEAAKAVSLRWVDTDKVDADRPNYRSRLVVREVKKATKKSDVTSAAELFSGIPPLEGVRALLSLFVSHSQEEAKGKRILAMCDISRAHFHGASVCGTPGRGERETRTRERILKENGFAQGLSNPSLFVHVERDIRLLIRGDDFRRMKNWFESVLPSAWRSSTRMATLRWKFRS